MLVSYVVWYSPCMVNNQVLHRYRLIPNPIHSCASGNGILALCHLPWSVMHKYSRELVLYAQLAMILSYKDIYTLSCAATA